MHISSIENNFKQCLQQWVLNQVSTTSQLVSRIQCWNLSKIRFPDHLSTFRKIFYPVLQITRTNLASWHPPDCLQKQSWFFWDTPWHRYVVCSIDSLDVQHFFQLVLPFPINCCNSQHLYNCVECVSPKNPRHLHIVHVTFDLAKKRFSRVVWEKLSRKHVFLEKNFVLKVVFLYVMP